MIYDFTAGDSIISPKFSPFFEGRGPPRGLSSFDFDPSSSNLIPLNSHPIFPHEVIRHVARFNSIGILVWTHFSSF